MDEKTQVQALDRAGAAAAARGGGATHSRLPPPRHHQPVRRLGCGLGKVITDLTDRHRAIEFRPPSPIAAALDRRQRPIPWWTQWVDYLDSARGHGGVRVH
jgi:hypothetical protein